AASTASCELLNEQRTALTLPGCSPILLNKSAAGYYISSVPTDTMDRISKSEIHAIAPAELIQLLQDQWLLAMSGRAEITGFLNLADGLRGYSNRAVMQLAMSDFQEIDSKLATGAYKQQYRNWWRGWLQQLDSQLAAESKRGESDDLKD